jgi:hypothetical protein
MRLSYLCAVIIFIVTPGFSGFGQELAEEEIRGVARGEVSFFNYEGPHEKVESAEEIRSIGSRLSTAVDSSGTDRAEYHAKYRIVRIEPEEDSELYGADVFSILEGAVVDHIDNVRRILSGYVQRRFGYSKEEADTIAVFISFYNAIHRGDMEYISGTYGQNVVNALDPEKAGIAIRYDQWPGQTQMLIPLRLLGAQAALSTDTVGEDEVVEGMREQEEDRGVEDRKKMVEIRDRELEEEERQTEEKQQELEEKEAGVRQKEAEAAEAKRRVEEAKTEEGRESRETREAEQDLEEAEEELKETQQESEELREEVEKEERSQAERRESIQQEREKIAEDQRDLIEEEERGTGAGEERAAAVSPKTLPFLIFSEDGEVLGRLVEILKADGSIRRRGNINTIRSRGLLRGRSGIVVVAGEDDPPRAIRLVEIDEESLEIVGQSDRNIYRSSVVEEQDGSIYAITGEEGKWYVGRFAADLQLAARSDAEVAPQTMLLFENGSLYVQDKRGDVIIIDPKTLQRRD